MIIEGKNKDKAICYSPNYIEAEKDEYVYHYTKAGSLLNILKNLKFRLSEYKECLDDPVDGHIKDRIFSAVHCNVSKDIIADCISKYRFISLTANENERANGADNSLLWYMYGENYAGACVVFSKQKLCKEVRRISKACEYIGMEYRVDAPMLDEIQESNMDFDCMKSVLNWKEISWSGQKETKLLGFSENWRKGEDVEIDVSEAIDHISLGFRFSRYNELFSVIYKNTQDNHVKLFSRSFSSSLFVRDNVEDGEYAGFINNLSNFPEYKLIDDNLMHNFSYENE